MRRAGTPFEHILLRFNIPLHLYIYYSTIILKAYLGSREMFHVHRTPLGSVFEGVDHKP